MATITGLTADRMLEIEASSVVDARIANGELILIQHDGTEINVGSVAGPAGPTGPVGPTGLGSIPGEVKLWSNTVLPDAATYGKWVWADGAYYAVATYPLAAANISASWKTFDGASDPGAGNFRVPDLRGLVPSGLDQMPGGSRANRMTRAAAITLASRSGRETYPLTGAELAVHSHTQPAHLHLPPGVGPKFAVSGNVSEGVIGTLNQYVVGDDPHSLWFSSGTAAAAPGTNNAGNGASHENVQPTVFVPYIVCLDV
jgi:microcystin-dependent protein